MSEENEDGQLVLLICWIEYQWVWEWVCQFQKEDVIIYFEVFVINCGGVLVCVEGFWGFIFGFYISICKLKEELVVDFLFLKFFEVDEECNCLVFSYCCVLVEWKMNCLEVGEVVVGIVCGIKFYGVFIDIGGVSGLLYIFEISYEYIEIFYLVLNVNDQMKVMIIDLDVECGWILLFMKVFELEFGDMFIDFQKVFEKVEEMVVCYKQMLMEQVEEGEDLISFMMI